MKKVLILFFCIIIGITIYLVGTNKNITIYEEEKKKFIDTFMTEKIEAEEAVISHYSIYGQNLNLKGTLSIDTTNISNINLVMINDDKELTYPIIYNLDSSNINFSTFEKINQGLYLDGIEEGNYILALKVTFTVEEKQDNKYYTIVNNTAYSDIDYYTITNNDKNNLISIKFNNYEDIKDYITINVSNTNELDEIYDILIDPGHGGKDSGAINGKYHEADIALDCAKIVKEKLEQNGFKVKLTRENSTDDINVYDAGGRVALAYETKAKYTFSIHLNSSTASTVGGIEIYSPNESNLDLAKSLADSLASLTSFGYSKNNSYKVYNGVYVKNFDNYLKKEILDLASKRGIEPYPVDENTPYLFMIRETGGINTHAYVDGRDSRYSVNKYYKSNIGTESYLLEIGYISNNYELNNIIDNKDKYADNIATSITNYIRNKK